jgi:hypothetical protein
MIVAGHEVPGIPSTEESRSVRSDVPYGTALWVALFQALRARLRSRRPSGTKALRLSNGPGLS